MCWISCDFYTYEHLKFHAQLSWAWKKFYNLGARRLSEGYKNYIIYVMSIHIWHLEKAASIQIKWDSNNVKENTNILTV